MGTLQCKCDETPPIKSEIDSNDYEDPKKIKSKLGI